MMKLPKITFRPRDGVAIIDGAEVPFVIADDGLDVDFSAVEGGVVKARLEIMAEAIEIDARKLDS